MATKRPSARQERASVTEPSADPLLDWAKRRKADRARLQREKDKEIQRRVVLATDALAHTAVKGFFRGVAIAIGIVALLWLLAQFGH